MDARRGRVLIVDGPGKTLLRALGGGLAGHDVEVARDALDAIDRIDCASRPHDVIFCDLEADIPGPELWAFLGLRRSVAAGRMVFVSLAPFPPETRAFLDGVPNLCMELPADSEALHALIRRRTSTPIAAAA